jgi:RNA polymerase sigma-70 factor (ECF subfamily)
MEIHAVDMERVSDQHPADEPSSRPAPLSPEAFSVEFQAASRTLWIIAAAVLGRRTDAEDVLQEAAMIGLRKVGDFQEGTSFGAWMGGIVRNVARNHARKRNRRQTSTAEPRTLDIAQSAPAPMADEAGFDRRGRVEPDQAGFDDRVVRALNTLEETARVCLLLRTLRDMPYREISALLGIPEGTAMSHVHRSRRTLRDLLSRETE